MRPGGSIGVLLWCRFFLQAVIDTAQNGKETFEEILVLRQELDTTVFTLGRRAENALQLIRHLYKSPAISIATVEELLKINRNPARELVAGLESIGVLEEITGFKRNRVYLFRRYLNIFRERQVDSKSVSKRNGENKL